MNATDKTLAEWLEKRMPRTMPKEQRDAIVKAIIDEPNSVTRLVFDLGFVWGRE